VRPDAENVERLKSALCAVWNDPHIAEISAEDLQGDYPTIRYGPPGETLVVDVHSRLSGAFRFEDIEAEEKLMDAIRVRVATPRMLYKMKRDTVRGQDRVDAAALRERFHVEDGSSADLEVPQP
jgi:hypothetical protein